MKGFIFAAGIGSRLKPFTDHHPKALVKVDEKPVILHVINRMVEAGITDITINVHHFPNQIIDYISSLSLSATFHISDESKQLLDTGGGLLHALELINGDEAVVAHNADILTNIDLKALIRNHQQSSADATLVTQPWRHSSRLLYYDTETTNLVGWQNTKTLQTRPLGFNPEEYTPCAFAGVHIFSPKQIANPLENYRNNNSEVFSIIPFYLDNLDSLNVKTLQVNENRYWFDVGRPETLELARNYFSLLKNTDNNCMIQ